MSRKTLLTPHEQLMLTIANSSPEQLEQLIRFAKATLSQKRPRIRKPKAVQEKETA